MVLDPFPQGLGYKSNIFGTTTSSSRFLLMVIMLHLVSHRVSPPSKTQENKSSPTIHSWLQVTTLKLCQLWMASMTISLVNAWNELNGIPAFPPWTNVQPKKDELNSRNRTKWRWKSTKKKIDPPRHCDWMWDISGSAPYLQIFVLVHTSHIAFNSLEMNILQVPGETWDFRSCLQVFEGNPS